MGIGAGLNRVKRTWREEREFRQSRGKRLSGGEEPVMWGGVCPHIENPVRVERTLPKWKGPCHHGEDLIHSEEDLVRLGRILSERIGLHKNGEDIGSVSRSLSEWEGVCLLSAREPKKRDWITHFQNQRWRTQCLVSACGTMSSAILN